MLKTALTFVFVAVCVALEAEPAQTEFMPAIGSVPQIIAQEQMFRRMADIYLGLQISSSFLQLGQLEYQKGQLIQKGEVPDIAALEEEDYHDSEAELVELEESANDEEDNDDDDVSLLQLKEEFFPGMMGFGAPHTVAPKTLPELEEAGAHAKFSALKALQIQFYLASSDVEKSYWINKITALALPPQLSIFKLYKTYLNTMALSTAFQFHDSFTQEAFMDDFNDRWGSLTGASSQYAEALAEQQVYSKWSMLAMIKYQLFTINLYEKMVFGQIIAQASAVQQQAYGAASYLEVEAEPSQSQSQFMPGMFGGPQMAGYMQYYSMWLKYSSIILEMQLANAGLMVAHAKISESKADDKNAIQMEHQYLPMLYIQWASTNQMKYYIEYYSLMTEMFFPQLAAAQAADRAENVFQNLVQTDAPTLTAPQEPAKSN